jgi:hypothetical protein
MVNLNENSYYLSVIEAGSVDQQLNSLVKKALK